QHPEHEEKRAQRHREEASAEGHTEHDRSRREHQRHRRESKSALFLVPGLAAYVVAIICVLLTALTVAREWELGSMEQLFATPVGRFEIVVGKLLPYLGLGLAAVTLVLSAGAVVFGVPFRGSLLAVALGSLLFVLGMLAQGLLISIVTKNQMVATQAAALSSMLPSMLLSGFLFPIENMPGVLQLITLGVPARHYIEILRGALLRGNSLWDLLEPIAALGAFSVALILISTVRFQRRLA
ncbi:MAG: ABC transporter permease, partial [Myxococcota bacterium]